MHDFCRMHLLHRMQLCVCFFSFQLVTEPGTPGARIIIRYLGTGMQMLPGYPKFFTVRFGPGQYLAKLKAKISSYFFRTECIMILSFLWGTVVCRNTSEKRFTIQRHDKTQILAEQRTTLNKTSKNLRAQVPHLTTKLETRDITFKQVLSSILLTHLLT